MYNDEQLEAALDLLAINSLPELSTQDFTPFQKKQSWIQLANGCITRLSIDLLRLGNVGETAERCALLHHRLENRKAARIRTPTTEAQNSIQTLYSCCMTVRDVWKVSMGKRVPDIERVVGKVLSLMSSWRAVSTLAEVTPETARLTSMVREALTNVIQTESREAVKNMAKRGLIQWSGESARAVGPVGTSVTFDSDDE